MPVLVTGAAGFVGVQGGFISAKAERELGYRPRPLGQTISATTEWYLRPDRRGSARRLAAVDRPGLLWPVRPAEKLLRRRSLAGR